MKSFICLVLAAVLFVQFSDALPRPQIRSVRLRREAIPKIARFSSSEEMENMTEKEKVTMFAIGELLDLGTLFVTSHSTFFNNVIKQAEGSKLNLNNELRELKDFSRAVDKLKDLTGEEAFEKTFELFEKGGTITDKYDMDEITNPTDNQRAMARLFNENGLYLIQLQFLGRASAMRGRFTTQFQHYVDSLSPAEKRKESKLVNWFNKFKNEKDFEKNMETMFEFFDLLED